LIIPICVLTVGKFEGIHQGHKALLLEVVRRAKSAGVASVVVMFSPHPFQFLRDPSYKPIFTESEREHLLNEIGIDHVITLRFDENFAAMKASEFCHKLFTELKAREIVVGEGYRFGNGREGTIETLRDAAKTYGGSVHVLANVSHGEAISTSNIRKLLSENKLHEAASLLGFPFFMMGEVKKGQQLGRVLGFPTLNLYPSDEKFLLQNGVYETITILDGVPMKGLTNIGKRPTVTEPSPTDIRIAVETHIPSLVAKPNEMYGRHIKVKFLRFLRPEQRFNTPEELQLQISKDLLNI